MDQGPYRASVRISGDPAAVALARQLVLEIIHAGDGRDGAGDSPPSTLHLLRVVVGAYIYRNPPLREVRRLAGIVDRVTAARAVSAATDYRPVVLPSKA